LPLEVVLPEPLPLVVDPDPLVVEELVVPVLPVVPPPLELQPASKPAAMPRIRWGLAMIEVLGRCGVGGR
jgi:hypothetical protein